MKKPAVLLLLLLPIPVRAQQKPPEHPNILIILASDLRPDAMGCYGNGTVRTPNFDAIAKEGARFDNFYTASPLSCPSRAALLTGLYPHQMGIFDDAGPPDLPPGATTLPRVLEKAGYVTGFAGKAHLGGDPRRWGFREGPAWLPGGSSPHRDPKLRIEGEEKVVEGMITPILVDAALAWIERHKGDRWLFWLALTVPHAPCILDPRHPYKPSEIDPPPLWSHNENLSDLDWAGYYSTVSMMDEQVGRLTQKLRDLRLHDDTLLCVLSDNGFMMGSHGYPGKGVWFEESVRVPALARWPARIKAGTRVWSTSVNVDLFPTLCEVAGAPKPEKAEAVSLLPALLGEGTPRFNAYSEGRLGNDGIWHMARNDRFKYVRFVSGREHLYDIYADASERRDLAVGARHMDDLEEMRALLQKWLDSTPK
jgi:N-acetylglucosamine-6-sulfatase